MIAVRMPAKWYSASRLNAARCGACGKSTNNAAAAAVPPMTHCISRIESHAGLVASPARMAVAAASASVTLSFGRRATANPATSIPPTPTRAADTAAQLSGVW